ncbi:hypothetical protein B0H10DRAFT_1960724 [Mycena sp. CBHHK59/15]|nr:hypothetical protein B0H10DRAFT_1960724 [Mycena sp. CBHHK59/15]
MLYVTDSAGIVIDGVWLLSCGLAPATWNKGSIDLQRSFSAEICEHYPEMRLCADDWKVQYMAKKMYSGWYKTYNNSRGIKSEAGDDDISESKPIKRSYCGDGAAVDSANKRTKVETQSTIPAPEQNNDEASVPVPVDIVNPLLSVSPPASTPSATPPEDAEGLTLDRFFLGAPEWHFVPSESFAVHLKMGPILWTPRVKELLQRVGGHGEAHVDGDQTEMREKKIAFRKAHPSAENSEGLHEGLLKAFRRTLQAEATSQEEESRGQGKNKLGGEGDVTMLLHRHHKIIIVIMIMTRCD